ncbi:MULTISPECIES: protein adenylyltransferase Fic [unclassified Lentimonas]|uniref:protein adenylyltransferase Fic n=1 Tax=unclassified Lentimonas TaxID=2630993 RepID=UPI001325B2D1|nr:MULTISPECIES: Fic/DOC family N-terminal domain-containing protein [unclassified Lentimonas]CAA6676473.1 MloA [Lentimonas sp. CC4]CAA6685313.1 MloA [Lentimonas sp. CC6]CAA7074963.1 MloA [Lentimonas sp. CC4]CAA7168360.1 MloA [Lentimonas sp. CC21]CAA7180604.1 MloA [Lentimonas sp. CC8]
MSCDPNVPFNDLPPLPPALELETTRVLKQCIRSRAVLAELEQAGDFLPNKALLINIMPLLEARASSEIENIVTTTDQLFRGSLLEQATDSATKEALNYRQSLYEGFQSLASRPLCTATAELVCSVIKGKEMAVRKLPGTALGNDATGTIVYTPPVGEDVIRDKLSNWEHFVNLPTDLDPLVVMAVAHYQFEAIHPFTDGNGRTGRVLNLLYLAQAGLLSTPILYHSRGIMRRKSEYYENLRGVTFQNDWESWIIYILEVVEESAIWTNRKIRAIRDLRVLTKARLKAELPKIYSAELLDVLFHQPYCRIADLVNAGVAKRQAAATYLKQLVDVGLLSEEKVGREKLFIHKSYLKLLLKDSK